MQGINTKSSKYITGQSEFLNLQNVDFQTFGSLSTTPGYTQFVFNGITGIITGISEFSSSQMNPFLFLIATTNTAAYNITGHTFQKSYDAIFYGQTLTPLGVSAGLETLMMYDFVRGSSALFGANQLDFFTAQQAPGPSYLMYSLPTPWVGNTTATYAGTTGGLSGILELDFAFVRRDGLVGPFSSATFLTNGQTSVVFTAPVIPTSTGVSYSNYGISGILVWYSLNNSSPKGSSLQIAPGATFGISAGATLGISSSFLINHNSVNYLIDINEPPEDIFGDYYLGSTTIDAGTGLLPNFHPFYGVNPGCLAQYNSQLFMGGFFANPSTVWFSNIGEFEKRDVENFFIVGDDDGDIVSNLVPYFTQLIVFKVNSSWMLSGTDPDTFALAQVTDQYGCLSNNSACIWADKLWFLDRKGVCEFNGANTRVVSTKIEPIFKRINISAARITSTMTHVKERNQVWCDFPIDGSSFNNIRAIYDYIADAWTTSVISQTTYLTKESKSYTLSLPYFGDYSGMIYQHGQSFTLNNGVAPTHVIQTRFLNDMGHSVEKMFRRLYVDATITAGSTQTWVANFYTDQGVTAALSMTLVLSDFQRRFDFGLPAADMSVEFIYSGGQFLKLNGYTIEYRFQRAVTSS